MFEETSTAGDRDKLGDWVLRGGVAMAFVLFGCDKFPSHAGASWVKFFDQVGVGQWFRYFTGLVEVFGALLVLIPKTAQAGLALLAMTMVSAALIVTFRLGQPSNAIPSAIFFVILAGIWWSRRDRDSRLE